MTHAKAIHMLEEMIAERDDGFNQVTIKQLGEIINELVDSDSHEMIGFEISSGRVSRLTDKEDVLIDRLNDQEMRLQKLESWKAKMETPKKSYSPLFRLDEEFPETP